MAEKKAKKKKPLEPKKQYELARYIDKKIKVKPKVKADSKDKKKRKKARFKTEEQRIVLAHREFTSRQVDIMNKKLEDKGYHAKWELKK